MSTVIDTFRLGKEKSKEKILSMKDGEHVYVSPFDAKIEYKDGEYELFELKCYGDGDEVPYGKFTRDQIDEMITEYERWT